MITIEILAAGLVVLGPAVAGIACLATRSRVALGVVAASIVLGAVWRIDVVLIARDYRDLDGLMDCYPYCSPEQEAASVVVFYTPLVMAAVVLGSLAVIVMLRWKARRGSRRSPGTGLPAASRR